MHRWHSLLSASMAARSAKNYNVSKADISIPLTHRLVLRALEAGECLSAFKAV